MKLSQTIESKITTIWEKRDSNFRNSRTARNIFLDSISQQENRLAVILNPTDEELLTILPEDII